MLLGHQDLEQDGCELLRKHERRTLGRTMLCRRTVGDSRSKMGACCADCTNPLPMKDTMKVPIAICGERPHAESGQKCHAAARGLPLPCAQRLQTQSAVQHWRRRPTEWICGSDCGMSSRTPKKSFIWYAARAAKDQQVTRRHGRSCGSSGIGSL